MTLSSFIEKHKSKIAIAIEEPETRNLSDLKREILTAARTERTYSKQTNNTIIWHYIVKEYFNQNL